MFQMGSWEAICRDQHCISSSFYPLKKRKKHLDNITIITTCISYGAVGYLTIKLMLNIDFTQVKFKRLFKNCCTPTPLHFISHRKVLWKVNPSFLLTGYDIGLCFIRSWILKYGTALRNNYNTGGSSFCRTQLLDKNLS